MITELLVLLLISTLVVGLLYLPFIRYGLNLADEGYLLFGTKCFLEGQVPIRDFRAYDPGRYYWCALWMKFLRPSFLSQRVSMAGLMIITLTLSSYLIFYCTQNWIVSILGILILFVLMNKSFKMFETTFIVLQIAALFLFLNSPGNLANFVLGVVVGGSLYIGINLALYSFVSSVIVLIIKFVMPESDLSSIGNVVLIGGFGLVLGLAPTFFLAIRYRGYLRAYWINKIRPILNR